MENDKENLLKKLQAAPLFTPINVPVIALTPCEYNPRTITDDNFEALKKSMKADPQFFQVRPLIVNVRKGRIGVVIAGDKRLKAAIELGYEKVPCILVKVSEAKEKEWNIKDNLHQGAFDNILLKDIIMDLRDEGLDLSTIGFNPQEIVDLTDPESPELEPSDDPEFHGSTPKVKIAAGAVITCPECGHKWTYGVAMESVSADDKS